MLNLQGKVAFVFGVASEDSIAWAICQSLADAGVTLYLGYQKRFMSRVFQLKDKLPAIAGFYPLDVASDADTKEFFDAFRAENPNLKADILIHALSVLHLESVSIGQFCLSMMTKLTLHLPFQPTLCNVASSSHCPI